MASEEIRLCLLVRVDSYIHVLYCIIAIIVIVILIMYILIKMYIIINSEVD